MKILMLLIRQKGGVGRVVEGQKKILKKRGHEVKVISREDDLEIYSLRKSLFTINRIIKVYNYDILITNDWSTAFPFMFFPRHYCCYHAHNPQKIGRIIQTIIGRIKGKKLFVVGDSLKKRFPKSTILYNGVDRKEFYDMNKKREYFGWIDKETEIHTEKEMDDLAKRYNLKLLVTRDIPHNKMNEYYNKLKVFASFPPKSAGFNLCWIEAIASGVPRVLGNENGIGITDAKEKFEQFNWEDNVNKLLETIKK